MKIFWSWQSDTPGKIGRFLVRDALQEAIEQLKEAPEIEEPTAKDSREALHLDHDVKGVSGSPDLARTIFEKMDNSEVIVADVTLVGLVPGGGKDEGQTPKKLINSNVAIELGYALRAVSDKRVLMVFNEHYGAHEELPFDLRHKGGSITFNIPPNVDRERINTEKKKLTAEFVSRLRPYLTQPASATTPVFEGTPSTFNKAAYFQKCEVLATVGVPDEDEVSFSYGTDSLCYLRLLPVSRLQNPLKLALLRDEAARAPLLQVSPGSPLSAVNTYGSLAYVPATYPERRAIGQLAASTQLFENGEIWCVASNLIVRERGQRPASVKIPMLHSPTFERVYYDTLRNLLDFAFQRLGINLPLQVECGVIDGFGIHVFVPPDEFRGPIRKQEILHRSIINESSAAVVDRYLLDYFNAVHDASGYSRPAGLFGFPPNRPGSLK